MFLPYQENTVLNEPQTEPTNLKTKPRLKNSELGTERKFNYNLGETKHKIVLPHENRFLKGLLKLLPVAFVLWGIIFFAIKLLFY